MKLVRHGDTIVAIVEHNREKAYLTSQQGNQEWVQLFILESQMPVAEIDPTTRQVRMCANHVITDQLEVMLHHD